MSRRATGVPARRAADLLFAVRAQDAMVFGEHENRQLQDFRRSGALPSLRLILRGGWQRPLVLEHLAEITTIDPAAAGRASDEMLGSVGRAYEIADVFSARDIGHRGPPVKREGYPLAGVFPVTGFTRWTRAQAGHRIEM
jgi:hypothetical protein